MDVIRKGVDSVATVLEFCIQSLFLRHKEAMHIFNAMNKELRDAAVSASKILPRMVDPVEAKSFMMQVISFDKLALKRLQHMMGNALSPIIGQYDGYYDLDLSLENDRICLSKLLMQSEHNAKVNIAKCVFKNGRTGDTGQHGDWSSFRNAMVGGQPGQICVDMFNPMPTFGHVSFDFSGSDKPLREAAVIKDWRCISVLLNLALVERTQKDLLQRQLDAMTAECRENIYCDGRYVPVTSKRRAEDVQLCMCKFYSRLPLRSAEFMKSNRLEEVRFGIDGSILPVHPIDEDDDGSSSDDSADSISHIVYEDDEMDEVSGWERCVGVYFSCYENRESL